MTHNILNENTIIILLQRFVKSHEIFIRFMVFKKLKKGCIQSVDYNHIKIIDYT
jgi:hypothetical protein